MKQSGINASSPARTTGAQTDLSLNTADSDGIKTSVATPTEDVVYSGSDLDGADITGGALSGNDARNVTLQTGAQAGAYVVGSTVTVTGKHPWDTLPDGSPAPLVEVFTIGNAGGGETFVGAKPFKAGEPLSIAVQAQALGSGTLEFGTGVARALTPPWAWAQVNASGTIYAHHSGDVEGNVVRKTVVLAAGQVPIGIDALHAGTDITDMWGKADTQ